MAATSPASKTARRARKAGETDDLPRRSELSLEEFLDTDKEFLRHLKAMEEQLAKLKSMSARDLRQKLGATASAKGRSQPQRVLTRVQRMLKTFEDIREKAATKTGAAEPSDAAAQAFVREARSEAEQNRQRMVAAGVLIEGDEFIARMKWTRQALSKALGARRVFCVELQGVRYYPAFFTDLHLDRKQLETVSKTLGDMPGSAKLAFFTTPKGSLARKTPLEALAAGMLEQVKTAAAGYAQA